MKKIIFILLTLLIVSCTEKLGLRSNGEYFDGANTYSLSVQDVIPDSLLAESRQYIVDLTSAASYHMTGGDYEDVDKTLYAARNIAEDLYGKRMVVLVVKYKSSYYGRTVLPNDMTEKEKYIFKILLTQKE